jgi:hypothetical protein
MEIPIIDASSIFALFRAPGLIAIAIAAFLAFVSLVRRTARLVLNRAKGISVISNQAAAVFSGEWSDTESEPDSEPESDSDASFSDEETDIDDMETLGDNCLDSGNRSSQGHDGNFDLSWGGAVVKSWEGLGLFGSCSNQPASIDSDDADNDTSETTVVRYWDDHSIRPKWRRRRSFVMMDMW